MVTKDRERDELQIQGHKETSYNQNSVCSPLMFAGKVLMSSMFYFLSRTSLLYIYIYFSFFFFFFSVNYLCPCWYVLNLGKKVKVCRNKLTYGIIRENKLMYLEILLLFLFYFFNVICLCLFSIMGNKNHPISQQIRE